MISKYRSETGAPNRVVAFSVSFDKDNLLARGLGVEHLREMLLRLARAILRNNADLAYGGNWDDNPDNFTYDLLNLISAEQQANSGTGSGGNGDGSGGHGKPIEIGSLYNHVAWPFYLRITPDIEAKWIKCCQIARISQQLAGIAPEGCLPDDEIWDGSPRFLFNLATCLSAMRSATVEPFKIEIPDVDRPSIIPPADARVVLGGKDSGYLGFLPGIFEEVLVTLDKRMPLYLIGGMGGAAETLANAILQKPGAERPAQLTLDWHLQDEKYKTLYDSIGEMGGLPPGVPHPGEAFDALWEKIVAARKAPERVLNTGLNKQQTRELLTGRDMDVVFNLIRTGLGKKMKMSTVPG